MRDELEAAALPPFAKMLSVKLALWLAYSLLRQPIAMTSTSMRRLNVDANEIFRRIAHFLSRGVHALTWSRIDLAMRTHGMHTVISSAHIAYAKLKSAASRCFSTLVSPLKSSHSGRTAISASSGSDRFRNCILTSREAIYNCLQRPTAH